jgi:hypothetical protein
MYETLHFYENSVKNWVHYQKAISKNRDGSKVPSKASSQKALASKSPFWTK